MINEQNLIKELFSQAIYTGNSYGRGIQSGINKALEIVQKQPKIVEQIPSTMLQTGFYDKNGNLIEVGDTVKLILDDGEERILDVRFKTVQRIVKCHQDFDDEYAKVAITGIVFCWEGYELFPCVDENGVLDTSKMEIIKKGGGIDTDPGSLIAKHVICEEGKA